uniref:cadherin-like beta sandwich domain-containing protein n=1 Tax=[Lactobacillus] rogosae TaxID=706562 RepID=UPI003FEEBA02
MNKVKKIISALLIICMCAVMAFVNKTDILAAGTARVSIGSASGTVGDTVSIDVSISASSGIGGATIYVSYDPSILALSGSSSNSGTAMVSFMDESTASSQSKTITFKIIGAGTSSLNVIGDSKVIDIDMQACSISKSSGSVTASAPASYSSDNTLSSLQISPGVLSPAFSPDVTTYTTSVGADCASLTVSAVPNDSKATVSVSGKRMDPGFNTTTITVTAENGSKRTYTIKTTKETNSASNENNQATGSDSSNGSTDNNNDIPDVQDPNSEAIQEPNITVDNAEYKIVSANDEHPLPDGYTPTEYDYNGTKVSAGVGIDTGVTIVYLESTDGKGESGYYVYDSVRKTFSQFVEVSQPQFTYCILAIDEASMELPEGYDVGRTVINGKEVDALLDRTGNYALFYGVSSTGETGWFRYNVNDGTIQGYAGYNMADEQVINTNTKTADSDKAFNTVSSYIFVILAVLAVVIIALIVVVIALSIKLSKSKKAFVGAMDGYEDEDIDEEDLDDMELEGDEEDILYDDLEEDIDEEVSDDAVPYQSSTTKDLPEEYNESEELELEEIDDK